MGKQDDRRGNVVRCCKMLVELKIVSLLNITIPFLYWMKSWHSLLSAISILLSIILTHPDYFVKKCIVVCDMSRNVELCVQKC